MRLAYLVSHPIQYFAPLFRELARQPGVDFEAWFCVDHGVKPSFDREFGKQIQYDVPLLDGYSHRFLANASPRPKVSFTGQVNPGVSALMLSGRYDAVVAHGYASPTMLSAILGPRHARTGLLLRGESNLQRNRSLPKRIVKEAALRLLFSRIDQFLAIGALSRAYYLHYGVDPEKVTVAPYSVDNDFFAARAESSAKARAATRERLGLSPERPLALVCSKLILRRGPSTR